MSNRKRKTAKPGTAAYDPDKPQNLNIPEYNSSSDYRESHELPAIENLNNEQREENSKKESVKKRPPKPNLGNKRDKDEDQREKIVSP